MQRYPDKCADGDAQYREPEWWSSGYADRVNEASNRTWSAARRGEHPVPRVGGSDEP